MSFLAMRHPPRRLSGCGNLIASHLYGRLGGALGLVEYPAAPRGSDRRALGQADRKGPLRLVLLGLLLLGIPLAPAGAAVNAERLAVLEFAGERIVEVSVVRQLADEVRGGALDALGGREGLQLLSLESQAAVLNDLGLSCEDGSCDVEIGRRLGARWIVLGEVTSIEGQLRLILRVFDTESLELLAMESVEAKGALDLIRSARGVGAELVRKALSLPAPAEARSAGVLEFRDGQVTTVVMPPARSKGEAKRAATQGSLGEFVYVSGGVFVEGCVEGDEGCRSEERQRKRAKVPAFSLARTPVTAAAYERCVSEGRCTAPHDLNEGCNWRRRREHPINCVDWHQAVSYCKWIGGRLPTAREWEYAAKSGREVIYPWGNEPLGGPLANFCDGRCKYRQRDALINDGFELTSPVGSHPKGATPWGLLDMAGNVWEWTATGSEAAREYRGGSWYSPKSELRTTARDRSAPTAKSNAIGFRCAR